MVAASIALAVVGWGLDADPQRKVVLSGAILGLAAVALLAWAVLLSGFRVKCRVTILAVVLLAAVIAPLLFEVRGVTGNLVPILGLRFVAPAEFDAAEETANGAPDRTIDVEPPQTWRDYPQFLGPDRDATLDGVRLAIDWEARPPRQVWEREVGSAWSGFAVRGRDAVTQEQRGEEECVVCYDLLTGDLRWIHAYRARYSTTVAGTGPRATPAITSDRVYAFGATGILSCLDRESGVAVWSVDAVQDNGATVNGWGMAGSPLVHGDLVIVGAGGPDGRSVVAYDHRTGARAWSGGDDRAGYASPFFTRLSGVDQIVSFNGASISAHDPTNGRVLWTFPWSHQNPNVAQPVVLPGDRLLASSGYGVGCALLHVARDERGALRAEEVWRNRALKAKFANFVHRDGHVYGLDEGILVCIDVATGERRWKGGRYGHGQAILAEDRLLVTGEQGELLLVAAAPEEHHELARFEIFDEKTWNSPALAAPYLLVRTERTAACYELPLERATPPAGASSR